MKEKWRAWMSGRYGMDGYGRFLAVAALLCVLVSTWSTGLLAFLGAALLIYCYVRMFSKNLSRRAQENYVYEGAVREVRAWWYKQVDHLRQCRTHRFYRCPQCRQQLRVPKGRGKIEITCPRCHKSFQRKS